MSDKAASRRYYGPPGDDRVYWLPRDRDELDAAWNAYFAAHPERDPSRGRTFPEGTTDETESVSF